MRVIFTLTLIGIEFLSVHSALAGNANVEATYLAASSRREPFVQVADEHVISFEHDLDGDGKPEHFVTRDGMRDGKQGYLWSVYTIGDDDAVVPMGEATFSDTAFAPRSWAKDSKTHGFYTFGPGGAGKGILNFYAIDKGRLTLLEERKIEPNGADKAEFDGLFAARLKGESAKIDLTRTALPKQPSTTNPNRVMTAPPESGGATMTPKPPPVVQPSTPEAPEVKLTTASEKPESSTQWGIIAVAVAAAIGLLRLLLNRRS